MSDNDKNNNHYVWDKLGPLKNNDGVVSLAHLAEFSEDFMDNVKMKIEHYLDTSIRVFPWNEKLINKLCKEFSDTMMELAEMRLVFLFYGVDQYRESVETYLTNFHEKLLRLKIASLDEIEEWLLKQPKEEALEFVDKNYLDVRKRIRISKFFNEPVERSHEYLNDQLADWKEVIINAPERKVNKKLGEKLANKNVPETFNELFRPLYKGHIGAFVGILRKLRLPDDIFTQAPSLIDENNTWLIEKHSPAAGMFYTALIEANIIENVNNKLADKLFVSYFEGLKPGSIIHSYKSYAKVEDVYSKEEMLEHIISLRDDIKRLNS
ncbi:hypothetical protein H9X96_03220 [Pedobacter sp. N36a]|uniref:hypothetical protein n=1 Tax=Pedobacter sp. N36a TaxID=2767996 RepID=UPI0016573322|nr:hypothetical protein [Pedobacter sp. N36a]MBC8984781.1 hypothetical protein [Pedobacter sp. N36a]